ncbi:hypothetical protein NM688_g4578 [Phlebia brevispora]|uniref:Uncharacterized protein n=1 Tax=Phlebia brevispora TaxID=194682 RepID=A0ACC1T296_9APHY|nr:hypothetical protein NM688_g4578 [Phlebia brevispora]
MPFTPSPPVSLDSFNTAGRLAVLATDCVAFTTTWVKTYRHVRQAAESGVRVGFSETLLQYGVMFFASLCLLEITIILVAPFSSASDTVDSFVMVIPNIVISRFLINLRQVDSLETSHNTVFSSRFSVLNFRMPSRSDIIGNLGEPLADNTQLGDDE